MTSRRLWLVLMMAIIFTPACNLFVTDPTEVPPAFEDIPPADDGWIDVADGVEYQTVLVEPVSARGFEMHIVRINPAQVNFRVHYRPDNTPSASQWIDTLANPLVMINASFFNESENALGLVVADGQYYGQSFNGFGGMFEVDSNANARIRSLTREGYTQGDYQQVFQAFPMLIEYGGERASTGNGFNDRARRSVIAQDRDGNILLMSTGLLGEISFNDLQLWLLRSGLNIDVAFNLDGGKSSTLFVNPIEGDPLFIPALSNIPVVLAVYPR